MARQGNSSAARAARMRATASYFGAGVIGGAKLPVSMPVAPLLFVSSARLAGWNGNAAKVARNANPTTPQTFGYDASGRLDLAAIEAYVGGVNVAARVDSLLDQSGNGFDLIQTTQGARICAALADHRRRASFHLRSKHPVHHSVRPFC